MNYFWLTIEGLWSVNNNFKRGPITQFSDLKANKINNGQKSLQSGWQNGHYRYASSTL